jgi:hypothetical protein
MKATLAVKFSLLAVSFLAAALLVGCATTTQVDWSSRVGNYTYDQAVAEYGSPTMQSQTNEGKVVAKWVTQPSAGASLNTGMSHYGSTGFAGTQTAGPGHKARVLQLTFDAKGKLSDWSKNY